MNKIPCASQNMEAKILPADVCIFGHFGQISPAAVHTDDCWFDSGVKWLIHFLSIITYLHKNSFLLHWNSCKQHSESSTTLFLIDCVQMLHSFWTQPSHWQMFMQKWWIHCFLISSTLLSHTTSIYNQLKRVCGVCFVFFFSCFLGQLPNLSDLHHLCLYECV